MILQKYRYRFLLIFVKTKPDTHFEPGYKYIDLQFRFVDLEYKSAIMKDQEFPFEKVGRGQ